MPNGTAFSMINLHVDGLRRKPYDEQIIYQSFSMKNDLHTKETFHANIGCAPRHPGHGTDRLDGDVGARLGRSRYRLSDQARQNRGGICGGRHTRHGRASGGARPFREHRPAVHRGKQAWGGRHHRHRDRRKSGARWLHRRAHRDKPCDQSVGLCKASLRHHDRPRAGDTNCQPHQPARREA